MRWLGLGSKESDVVYTLGRREGQNEIGRAMKHCLKWYV